MTQSVVALQLCCLPKEQTGPDKSFQTLWQTTYLIFSLVGRNVGLSVPAICPGRGKSGTKFAIVASLVDSLHFATAIASSNLTQRSFEIPSLPIVTP